MMWSDRQLDELNCIAIDAGREIMEVYNQAAAIEVSSKEDSSPLTEADRRAHQLIERRLQQYSPDIPVFSEESDQLDYSVRRQWQCYYLVDPLDGTKEFIKRNGEFTVNIALIENGIATVAVVHVPITGISYLGKLGLGAWKLQGDNCKSISVSQLDSSKAVRVVASRSHRGELLDKLIQGIDEKLGDSEVLSMGSSLKICLLAEGAADIYPRLAPTCEWDTAAAHAILSAAGGEIVDTNFQVLRYNQKAELLNPFFIAIADPSYDWQSVLGQSLDMPC